MSEPDEQILTPEEIAAAELAAVKFILEINGRRITTDFECVLAFRLADQFRAQGESATAAVLARQGGELRAANDAVRPRMN